MTEYVVQWSIEVDAESPIAAAKQALERQRDSESIATIFSVRSVVTDEVTLVDADYYGQGARVLDRRPHPKKENMAEPTISNSDRAIADLVDRFPGFDDDTDVNGADLVDAVGAIWPTLKAVRDKHVAALEANTKSTRKQRGPGM